MKCVGTTSAVRDVLRMLPRGHREETTAEAFELLTKQELGK